jgi:hypothetical protein
MSTRFKILASYNILQYLCNFIHVLIFVTVSKCQKNPKFMNILILLLCMNIIKSEWLDQFVWRQWFEKWLELLQFAKWEMVAWRMITNWSQLRPSSVCTKLIRVGKKDWQIGDWWEVYIRSAASKSRRFYPVYAPSHELLAPCNRRLQWWFNNTDHHQKVFNSCHHNMKSECERASVSEWLEQVVVEN